MALVIWIPPNDGESRTLIPEQGGGPKGRSAINQATQQVIENLHQKPAINLYLDLRACFNMMVEACHNLACHRHGANAAYLQLHVRMHQLMRYFVRHKFGVSQEFNTFEQHPRHGAGQGAADAALWYIVLSDTMIDAYHTKIAPSMMQDPTTTIEIIRSLKAFIDDVVLHVSNPTEGTIEELTNIAQNQLRWWDQLVQVPGGMLNPKKCCRMLYNWTPDKRGILKLNKPEAPLPPITLPHDNSQQEVHLLNPSAGTRYLDST